MYITVRNIYIITIIVLHRLSEYQLENISEYFPCYSIYGVSALDSSVLLQERPHGGCLVIYPHRIRGGNKYIHTVSKRVCALSIVFNQFTIFIYVFICHVIIMTIIS